VNDGLGFIYFLSLLFLFSIFFIYFIFGFTLLYFILDLNERYNMMLYITVIQRRDIGVTIVTVTGHMII